MRSAAGPETPCPLLQVVGDGVEVVGHGSGGFDVEDPPQALAGSSGVALTDDGCSQVPVLQCQGDAAAGKAADVPGDGSAEAHDDDVAVGVVRDAFVVEAVAGGVVVDPGDERCDAGVGGGCRHRVAGAPAVADAGDPGWVRGKQHGSVDDAFEHADGVGDRRDHGPGNFAGNAAAGGCAVAVACAFEEQTVELVADAAGAVVDRVGTAADLEFESFAGADAAEVEDHDHRRCRQAGHEERCFVKVDVRLPLSAVDHAVHR